MSKHTPGPWVVEDLIDGYDIHAPEAGCFVATASDPEQVWGALGREANARLIAAAPELLEAVEELLACTEGQATYNFMEPQKKKARAAIAKAKGEE